MMMNCDKFFAEELQAAGYDLDCKKLYAIYKKSREKHKEAILKGKTKYRKNEAAAMALIPEVEKHLED